MTVLLQPLQLGLNIFALNWTFHTVLISGGRTGNTFSDFSVWGPWNILRPTILPRTPVIHQCFSGQPSGLLRNSMCNGYGSRCSTGLKCSDSIGGYSWCRNRFRCVTDERTIVCPPPTGGFYNPSQKGLPTSRTIPYFPITTISQWHQLILIYANLVKLLMQIEERKLKYQNPRD